MALQAASLGVPVKLASGAPLSVEYEKAGRGRMLSGILGICHTKGVLLWRGVGSNQTFELLMVPPTSQRPQEPIIIGSRQPTAGGCWPMGYDARAGLHHFGCSPAADARSVRARSASPGS